MRELGYSGLPFHAAEHRELRDWLMHFEDALLPSPRESLGEELTTFLEAWTTTTSSGKK